MTTTAHPYGGNGVSVADGLAAKEDWEWIAHRWPDLRARLRPTNTGQSEVRTAPKSKPPIDLFISDLMFEITEKTRWYADELMREEDWTPRTSTMPGLLLEVAERFGHWISNTREVALEYCDWAHDYRTKVTRALERPPQPTYLGPCKSDQCDGDIYYKPGAAISQCRWCESKYDVKEHMEWVQDQLRTRIMTQSEIATALQILNYRVSFDLVRKWVQRGREWDALTPDERKGKSKPSMALHKVSRDLEMFRLRDAEDLAQRRK